ncbi:MAG: hypothetical protein RIK87_08425 [Fuerstiella sp.]
MLFEAISEAFNDTSGKGQRRRILSAKAQPGEKRLEPTLTDLMNRGLFS